MDTKTFLENLEALHKEWQGRLGTTYTKDGVMYHEGESEEQTIEKWFASPKRIAIVLKDQHQFEGTWDEDIRYWLKDRPSDTAQTIADVKERNRNLKPPILNGKPKKMTILKPIAYIIYGLMNIDKEHGWTLYDVQAYHEMAKETFNTKPFAFVECKKYPGGPTCSDSILQQHINTYGDLLKKELELLNPNMIVCTSHIIYNYVKGMYPADEITEFGDDPRYGKIAFHEKTGTLIFNSFHPSARKSYEYKYEYVLYHYRKFLQSK